MGIPNSVKTSSEKRDRELQIALRSSGGEATTPADHCRVFPRCGFRRGLIMKKCQHNFADLEGIETCYFRFRHVAVTG